MVNPIDLTFDLFKLDSCNYYIAHCRELSDVTRDGQLNLNEFIVACKLIQMKLRGNNIPPALPEPLLQLVTAAVESMSHHFQTPDVFYDPI